MRGNKDKLKKIANHGAIELREMIAWLKEIDNHSIIKKAIIEYLKDRVGDINSSDPYITINIPRDTFYLLREFALLKLEEKQELEVAVNKKLGGSDDIKVIKVKEYSIY